ncbi:uncharacterized protein Z520_07493 [Fonsecaea multimorphosa CBS 102226]|uniref:DNA (cytosine-5-)-methyltransferase n=1 Tax=Fonsecaea multimorphosa CBS 102226 TaxID=1442371 RepID=A0A0D2KJL2_9EURO|nr:uncharacterized protein Z520_07493 [Fonsecaea multimorphosa CBS 102226]KIX96773.1 hypothetical protein Z520_07493 [Fonsecaea multimorphosa CBS 102226]
MYRTAGVAAHRTRTLWTGAWARQSAFTRLRLDFLDHLSEINNSDHEDVIVLDDEENDNDSDEELVVTGSRHVSQDQTRKVVDIDQVQRVARGPLRLLPGYDVQLADQSFLRIVEHLPDTGRGVRIRGPRLLFQNQPELLMPERKHELVQLVKINNKMEEEYTTDTVNVDQVVRNCTVVFTNREYNDLHYRKHIGTITDDEDDAPIYFCRWMSADSNVGIEGRDPSGPPLAGRDERIRAHQADNGALVTPEGPVEFSIPDSELRRQWRGEPRSPDKDYSFGDTFCGAGGTTAGAFQAGLRLKFGVDFDEQAIRTYKYNFGISGTKAMRCDISDFIKAASMSPGRYLVDFLHMSPPCQPFCGANRNPNLQMNEQNIHSFGKVPAILEICKPRIVTLEEAKSLLDIDKRAHFRDLICWFIRKGYSVQWKAVDLSRYGVPQTRNRLIIIAAGPGEQLPPFVQPTHGTGPGLLPPPSINRAINSIPVDAPHQEDIPRMRKLDRAYSGEGLCRTIMTSVKQHHYHPCGTRRFSIREYASLQTFAHDFVFSGTLLEKLRQIGNAVPPLFAETLFKHLKAALTAADEAEDGRER